MLQDRSDKTKKILIAAAVLIVVLAGAAGYFFWRFQQAQADPNAAGKETAKRLVQEVGRLYQLPTDEEPTVAQVQDKEKLKDQSFFKNAQNGDYIIIYTNNKLAILYREKDNKLINVGPVNISDNNVAKPTVGVLNGSGDGGKLSKALSKLGGVATVNVNTSTSDAKNKNTSQTVVVDVSKNHSAEANAVAQAVGGQVQASLPGGESAPAGSDIVVIVGKNQQ